MRDSDRRKLRERIKKTFSLIGDQQLEELLPKSAPIFTIKLQHESIIKRGKDPLFFTTRENGDELIPTCYALHLAPQALARVVHVYDGVETNIMRGDYGHKN